MNCEALIRRLRRERRLTREEWVTIFETYDREDLDLAMDLARELTQERIGKRIWFRGIVEFSNICKCDCLYCGIRCSNHRVRRYRLTQ